LDKLLIIDCHAVCHSVRHAYGGLTWEDRNTGVIFGFLDRILSLSSKFECTNIAFTWDSGKSFRENIFPAYKEKRHNSEDKTTEEIEIDNCAFAQFSELRQKVLPLLGFSNIFIQTGFEADDIIAYLVRKYHFNYEIIIATDDQDLYQLLDHASMWKLKKKVIYTEDDFTKEYKITPQEWVWVKTIGGCSGDGVPGLPGIGVNRAIGYIKGTLTKGKYHSIIKHADKSFVDRNRALVKLPFTGTGPFTLMINRSTMESITNTCEQYGMYSLIKGRRLKTWKTFL
jgi:DNA polymerase-1